MMKPTHLPTMPAVTPDLPDTGRRRLLASAIGIAAASFSLPAHAVWPEKPIRIIVTFPPGGSSDIFARIMAEHMGKRLGQSVVVDNRPGAGGTIGAVAVMQAPPDGYTFMLSNSTPIALGPFAVERQPYDPVEAFTHVANLGAAPLVIMANPKAPFHTVAELVAQAKKAGQLDFGSGGPGSIGHIHGELMKKVAGINLVHVPYRGGAPMTTDLIAGIIPCGIDVITAYLPFFKSGQLVPIAVTSSARSPLLPEVPSVVEAKYPQLVLENFFGLSGPAKLPADIVARVHATANEVLALPEVRGKLADLAITPGPMSTADFGNFVRAHVGTLGPLVKSAGVKL